MAFCSRSPTSLFHLWRCLPWIPMQLLFRLCCCSLLCLCRCFNVGSTADFNISRTLDKDSPYISCGNAQKQRVAFISGIKFTSCTCSCVLTVTPSHLWIQSCSAPALERIPGGFSEYHVIFLTPSSPAFIFDFGLLSWNKNRELLAHEMDHHDWMIDVELRRFKE